MTFEQRQAIRHAIDSHKRAQIARTRHANPINYCAGCGTHKDNYQPGCGQCRDRRRNRIGRSKQTVPCTQCGKPIALDTIRTRKRRGWTGAGIKKCRACRHREQLETA